MTHTIGILGGGQLARMLTLEAKRMGYRVVVLTAHGVRGRFSVAGEGSGGPI